MRVGGRGYRGTPCALCVLCVGAAAPDGCQSVPDRPGGHGYCSDPRERGVGPAREGGETACRGADKAGAEKQLSCRREQGRREMSGSQFALL